MIRRSAAFLLAMAISPGLAASAATPASPSHRVHHHPPRHRMHTAAASLPAAAMPAGSRNLPPPAEGPAPVPNESVSAPVPDAASGTKVEPSVFQLHYPPQGEGYVDGSSPQAMDDHNAAKATGVEMKMPLPQ